MCASFAFTLGGSDALAGIPCLQTVSASCETEPAEAAAAGVPVAGVLVPGLLVLVVGLVVPLVVTVLVVALLVPLAALLGAGVELLWLLDVELPPPQPTIATPRTSAKRSDLDICLNMCSP